jgi:hypothetical protein
LFPLLTSRQLNARRVSLIGGVSITAVAQRAKADGGDGVTVLVAGGGANLPFIVDLAGGAAKTFKDNHEVARDLRCASRSREHSMYA